MPKPRKHFPYWELARELEVAEGISLAEAVQRVVESAIEDAVDSSLGHLEKGFRSVRSTKATLKELREQYEKHHPRADGGDADSRRCEGESKQVASSEPLTPEVLPAVESETTGRASALIDEQMENLIRHWRERGTKT